MSIIEKAAGRLGQSKADAAAAAQATKPSIDAPIDTTLDHAVRSERAGQAATSMPSTANTVPSTIASLAAANDKPVVKAKQEQIHGGKRVEINLERLAAKNMVTSGAGRSPVAEEFRVIKRPLIDNAFAEDGRPVNRNNLIMVSSALPGEGKTFTSINLAISIAMELDHTVLLVDADVARPSVLRTLGLKAEAGLMDLLLNPKTDVSDVLLKTNIDTLSILPAGKSHRNATELLASQTMSSLLDEIASRYPDRIVIFDSPPLLLTSEARVLASQMGQIVVVVEAETTTVHAVKSALSQLEACSNVNLVYNKAKNFPGQENYGYYYG